MKEAGALEEAEKMGCAGSVHTLELVSRVEGDSVLGPPELT